MSDFAKIVEIYRAIRKPERESGTTEGDLPITDESLRSFLVTVVGDEDLADNLGLAILSEPEGIEVGASAHIRLFAPKGLPVYRSLEAYLGIGARLLDPIGEFYFVAEDCFSEESEASGEVGALNDLHLILTKLCDSATIVDKDKSRLLFADGTGVVDVPIKVHPKDLESLTPEDAGEFISFCSDPLHRHHRLEAVVKVVIQQTRGVPANKRLHHILCNMSSILADAKSQHAVFLSAFSYDKVRDEIEALKVEYASKIHRVLSDIQGQLLGIPAATVVVATQMREAADMGSPFITNASILLGVFVFGVFLILILKNQGHTLEVIETEVRRQKRQLKIDLEEVADGFEGTFQMLENRTRHQRVTLWTVGVVVVLGVFLTCVAFWALSAEALKAMFQGS